MRERLFGEHPLARSPNGLVATVSNLGAGELREHHGRIVRRGGLVLSIAGAMDEARLRRLATALIRRIPPGAVDASQPPFPPRTRAVRETVRLPREQAVVFLGFPGPGVRDPDFVAAEVAHELFSGMASRLFERVREEKGLAYFIRSGRVVGVDAGGFHFEGGTQAGREGEVLAEIRAEIRRIRSGGATTEELARCHKRLIVARRMQLQTVGSRAMQCGLNQLLGLPVDDTARHEREVSAVDAKRLSAFAKRWFRPAQEVEFVVLPEG
jgi:zinc protease